MRQWVMRSGPYRSFANPATTAEATTALMTSPNTKPMEATATTGRDTLVTAD